ncbi:hypothetical protein [Ferruginibacter profundus]
MKKTLSILIIAAILSSCGNSSGNQTASDAKELASAIKQMQPGGIPTTPGGWTMTAKFDGKEWSAEYMMPLQASGRIYGDNNGISLSFPYDRREMTLGYKNTFSDHNAVDIFTKDEVALWGGYAGEMVITKVDGDWVEGRFNVTGTTSSAPDKKVEVTDGFFRISIADKK